MNAREVLIVCHGSRSQTWTQALWDWFQNVSTLTHRKFPDLRLGLSFLEINDPSFEASLHEFSIRQEHHRLAILPFFLSRSGHAGEEIPEIIEGVRKSIPSRIDVLPPEGWTNALGRNLQRRLSSQGVPAQTPIIISGYGSSGHDDQWVSLITEIKANSGEYGGMTPWEWAPSGHFLEDYEEPLRDALCKLREAGHQRVAIFPLYLAQSTYQTDLIPRVIKDYPKLEIYYQPDSILPDPVIVQWGVERIDEWLSSQIESSPLGGPT